MGRDDPAAARAAAAATRVPGEAGVWVLILGEMVVFAILFAVYLDAKASDNTAFAHGRLSLDLALGITNTIVLLTSSLLVAIGVGANRSGSPQARNYFFAAAGLGGLFILIKVVEYHAKLLLGTSLFDNPFFQYYFMLTGIHLLHVILGVGVLLFMAKLSGRPGSPSRHQLIESGGIFWHLVDLLWIIIFPLLYVLR